MADAKARAIDWLEAEGTGERTVQYRLRDWLLSRQRFWGCPIPVIYCDDCGIVPVPDADLPIVAPDDVEFTPSGESPLKHHDGFLNVTCPACGEEVPDRARFCPACGTPQNPIAAAAGDEERRIVTVTSLEEAKDK